MSPAKSPLSEEERFWLKVTKSSEGCWLWTAATDDQGYGKWKEGNRAVLAHRYSYEREYGRLPGPHVLLDHFKCFTPACVRPEHLRPATTKQNIENRAGLNSNNTSGVRGVHWYAATNKWQAQVRHNRRNVHVGYFANIADAEAAVVSKRLELYTHNERDRA